MEDLLFWQTLGRTLARGGSRLGPVLIVHALGEATERSVEGQGGVPLREAGLLVAKADTAPGLLRAAKEENRAITATLTDEGVPAVGFLGVDRSLFRWQDGELRPGTLTWIEALADSRAVPVLGALAQSDSGWAGEWALGVGIVPLCCADDSVMLLSAHKHIPEGPITELDAQRYVPTTTGLGTLLDHGVSVRISEVSGLLSGIGARRGEVYRSR